MNNEDAISSPTDFLKLVIGGKVIVRLHSGADYHGKLVCLDGYMNIAMCEAEEWLGDVRVKKYGDAFIRGNNGKFYFSSIFVYKTEHYNFFETLYMNKIILF